MRILISLQNMTLPLQNDAFARFKSKERRLFLVEIDTTLKVNHPVRLELHTMQMIFTFT